ncbi:uncharacterized protein LOC124934974 [Impatiens glandulifera]|uniref:uncharacterized protein LOC124934974 n=1 Tax=Impatiens glandulifera TaxID=253017 RepID=UPI001FB0ADFD|nr:uncharacterized protein LOC124934974 [Impatiens glandulifera]
MIEKLFVPSAIQGLMINEDKISVFYGGDDDDTKVQIQNNIGINECLFPIQYLGIPLTARQIQIVHCRPLIRKVKNVIMGWAVKKLSYAGIIELVDNIVMGFIGYWSQQIVLSKKVMILMKELETLIHNFIWGS